ncbi:unnamed protein product [Blepharisma stoltei]|uniref:Uncharacterized protein n=1 Tax=Blepharisma stoltei TaxID=1481888 RepID=A0AAU9KIA4_9CILI|nr:unnamed protein product [Blepharisma stoltei]
MSAKCQWRRCSNDSEWLCKCISEGYKVCKEHLPDHLEEVGFNHSIPESLFMRIDPQCLAELNKIIQYAKEKIDREYANVLNIVKELTRALNEKVEMELKQITIMQQNYIAAFEIAITHERIRKSTISPKFQEILANFNAFKDTVKDPNWFSVTLNDKEVKTAIDDLIKVKIIKPDLFKITGMGEDFPKMQQYEFQEEAKENPADISDTGSYEDELVDFDPNS